MSDRIPDPRPGRGPQPEQKKPKAPSRAQLERELAETQAELEQNLAELAVKFDVPAQAQKLVAKSVASYRRDPLPWLAAGAAAAVAAAGLIAWAVRRR